MIGVFAALKSIWTASAPAEVEEYLQVFSEPGALTAALNWYRGSRGLDPEDPDVTFGPVDTPTLTIWGNQDRAIGQPFMLLSHGRSGQLFQQIERQRRA